MSRITVALLGAGGQLGQTIAEDWQQHVTLHRFDRSALDVSRPEQLDEALSAIAPTVIVNAAAYTQVDRAESEQEQALRVNGEGAAAVAGWAAQRGCRLLHVSTDFVFDGSSSKAYGPEDTTSPINCYGASKLEGEQAVRRIHPQGSIIVRTSWLYSRFASNFVTTMLRLMNERDSLRVVADQIGSPTSTHSLAQLLQRMLESDVGTGLFHWSDAGVASWYDFAVAIQEEALAAGLLSAAVPIEPIPASEYPTPAARPAFSVLDKTATYEQFQMPAVHWRSELRQVISELLQGRKDLKPHG